MICVAALAVACGGALGALARYEIGLFLVARVGAQLPWATLLINVSGAFALGFFMASGSAVLSSVALHRFVTVGFLGAFTTFSTLSYEFLWLLQSQRPREASLYLAATISLGVLAVWLGSLAAQHLANGHAFNAVVAIKQAYRSVANRP